MSRPYTGNTTTRIRSRKQKNGDTYFYEEQRQYSQEKKMTITIGSKLIGKKLQGSDEIVSTRPRRKLINVTKEVETPLGDVNAVRKHVGMMDIVNHMAESSGIDKDMRDATDLPTAIKILSLARYIVCTDAHSLAGIEEWQYMHELPYEDGIDKDACHRLFKEIGNDETLQQAFFKARLDREGEAGVFLACDSSTSSTYSSLLTSGIARQGYNKDDDGLPTVKYLVLFSLKTKMPVWFTKLPGNVPDVITVKPILDELKALGIKKVTLVSDNGYYSESNIGEMLRQGYDFITLASPKVSWIRDELDKVCIKLHNPAYVCPFDIGTHGLCIPITRAFHWTRTYGSKAKGIKPGDKDSIKRKVWLHFFLNPLRKVEEDKELKARLLDAKAQLEAGVDLETMPKSVRELVHACCDIKQRNNKITVTFLENGFQEACKYHGFFALVANQRMDCFDCLMWYRRREDIEDFFRRAKQDALMRHTGVWDSDTLQGRMFVQFVALCLYQHTENEMFRVKDSLCEETDSNGKAKPKTLMDEEKTLWNWMDKRSIVRILNWFDVQDRGEISIKLKRKRWSDAALKRDKMFLKMLGVVA